MKAIESDIPLSTAIREGSKLRPQVTESFYFGRVGEQLGSCALGAAYEAVERRREQEINEGSLEHFVSGDLLDYVFPIIFRSAKCPVCGERGDTGKLIVHLNDDHKRTREQIAEWVESVESEAA